MNINNYIERLQVEFAKAIKKGDIINASVIDDLIYRLTSAQEKLSKREFKRMLYCNKCSCFTIHIIDTEKVVSKICTVERSKIESTCVDCGSIRTNILSEDELTTLKSRRELDRPSSIDSI